MCRHIFAWKRCLELFNLADTSNKTWWLQVEVKQIQPLIYMYYFSWEGNEVVELLSKGSWESPDFTVFKMGYKGFNSGSGRHPTASLHGCELNTCTKLYTLA